MRKVVRKNKNFKDRLTTAFSTPANNITPATIRVIDACSAEKREEPNVTKRFDKPAISAQEVRKAAPALAKRSTAASWPSRNETEINLNLRRNIVEAVNTVSTDNPHTSIQEVVTSEFDAFKQIPTAKSVAAAATYVSKAASGSDSAPHIPFHLKYKDGQWSPENADGLRFYNRDQLILLREVPASKISPSYKNVQRIRKCNIEREPKSNTDSNDLQPLPSQQQNHAYDKRPLQNAKHSGVQGGKKQQQNNHVSKPGMIHISLSLRKDVRLAETENAWKPTFYQKDGRNDNTTIPLYKRVRGILNKLTPEKFDTLLGQMIELNIYSVEQLNEVIVLLFEKAIDEPNFSEAYAMLCQKLSAKWLDNVNRPVAERTGKGNVQATITEAEKVGQYAQFKNSLITKCQIEFTNHVENDEAIDEMLAPFRHNVNEATDLDLRAEYMTSLDEEERRLRRRSVGTVKFIGELYKLNMLTTKIIAGCVKTLLFKQVEYKLECLCKLLTTVGQKMELKTGDKSFDLSEQFKQMQLIVDKKIGPNVSSRVRFMLKDVIELRNSNWTLRHTVLKPQTMKQIQREAEKEQNQIHFLNYPIPGSRRNDDRGTGGRKDYRLSRRDGGGGGGGYPNEGWSSVPYRSIPVDPNKLRTKSIPDDNTTLGISSQYKWNHRQAPSSSSTVTSTNDNSFSILARDTTDGGGFGRHNSKDSYHRDRYGGRNSRSGLQHGSREYSSSRNVTFSSNRMQTPSSQRSSASQSMHSMVALQSQQQHTTIHVENQTFQQSAEPDQKLIDTIKTLTKDLLQAHAIGEVQLADSHIDLQAVCEANRWEAVRELYNFAVELLRLQHSDRIFAGQVCCHWIATKTITVADYLRALREFFELVDDLVVDIPKIWQYIAECITPSLKEKHITLRDILSDKFIETQVRSKFIRVLLPHLAAQHGPQFVRDLLGDCEWSEFMPAENVEMFIRDNQLEFLTANAAVAQTSYLEKVQNRIKSFLTEETKFDDIFEYISANATIDKHFIRTLTSIVVDYAVAPKTHRLIDDNFKKGIVLLNRYIDNKEPYEVECLNMTQILIRKLKFPSGLLQILLSILLEGEIISVDGFKKWLDTTEESEGKDVAIKSLNTFLTQLKETQG